MIIEQSATNEGCNKRNQIYQRGVTKYQIRERRERKKEKGNAKYPDLKSFFFGRGTKLSCQHKIYFMVLWEADGWKWWLRWFKARDLQSLPGLTGAGSPCQVNWCTYDASNIINSSLSSYKHLIRTKRFEFCINLSLEQ